MGKVGLILQVRPYFCHFRCEFPTPLLADRQIPSVSLVQEGESGWREDRAASIPQEAQRFVPLWERKDEAWDSGCGRFIMSPPIGLEFPVLILLTFSKNQLLVSSISLLFFFFLSFISALPAVCFGVNSLLFFKFCSGSTQTVAQPGRLE